MALYRLMSVKFSRRVHKKDADGNLMYRDEERKIPLYEVKSYGVGDTVELSASEAKRLKNDIKLIGGTVEQSTTLQFVPDDGGDIENEDVNEPKIAAVLSGNVEQVLTYISDHEGDDETLEALREAEKAGKARKGVLDALNDLLVE